MSRIELIPEEDFVPPQKETKIASKMLTIYEYTAVIHARAVQLTSTTPLVDPAEYGFDPLKIAEAEIKLRLPRLVICRHLTDGIVEPWKLEEVFFPFE